jgi:hypothetical protein
MVMTTLNLVCAMTQVRTIPTQKQRNPTLVRDLNNALLHYYPTSYGLLFIAFSPILLAYDYTRSSIRAYSETTGKPIRRPLVEDSKADVTSSEVKVETPTEKIESDNISDLEWNSYSDHTRKIALLAWKKRESVPKGFLSIPEYRSRFLDVEEIHRQLATEPGFLAGQDPRMKTIKDIPVNSDYADTHDYIVEDPSNPGQALYLDQDEYTRLQNTCISNKKRLRTLKSPGQITNQKFPPRPMSSYRTKWLNLKYLEVYPFIGTDLFSWASYINPAIAEPGKLRVTRPSSAVLGPNSPITRATGQIVRFWSTMQAICFIYCLSAELSWLLVTLGLIFMSEWYYTSLSHACSIFKEAKRLLMKYLAGTPEYVSLKVKLSIDKRGLPRLIPSHIRNLIVSGDELAIKVTFLGLDTPKMFVYLGSDNTSPITGPSLASERVVHMFSTYQSMFKDILLKHSPKAGDQLNENLSKFVDLDDTTLTTSLSCLKLFFTTKAGPNGQALLSSPLDAVALLSSPALPYIERITTVIGCSRFFSYMVQLGVITRDLLCILEKICERFTDVNAMNLVEGRISRVYTAYGKCRLVAIPTYFVQVLFRPLHLLVFSILKRIPNDSTFNQEGGVERVIATGGQRLRSFDLSSATDRLPLDIQVGIVFLLCTIAGMSPQCAVEYSHCWQQIIRRTLFRFVFRRPKGAPKGAPAKFKDLSYGCGHPMGTYSSWAVFTLTHHLIIQLCAVLAIAKIRFEMTVSDILVYDFDKITMPFTSLLSPEYQYAFKGNWYTRYEMLGDDIVFFAGTDFELLVSDIYLGLMPLLGVEIHPTKGFDSNNSSFEFAKMFVRKGRVLNNLRWGEWAGQWEPGMASAAATLAEQRGFELCTLDVFLTSVLNLLPYNYKGKLDHFLELDRVLQLPFGEARKLNPYLSALHNRLLLSVYQVDLPSWVQYCMGAIRLPSVRGLCKEHSRQYYRIGKILDLVSLLLLRVPTKLFTYVRGLDVAIISTLVTFLKKNLIPVDAGDKTIASIRSVVFRLYRYSPQFCAFFLLHPALRSLDMTTQSFDARNAEDLEMGYGALEYSPELGLSIDSNIKNSDAACLEKPNKPSFDLWLSDVSLVAHLCSIYHRVCEGESAMTIDSLDFNIQSFVNCLRPLKAVLHTDIEKFVNMARSQVSTWVYPLISTYAITDGSVDTFLTSIYGEERFKTKSSDITHLRPHHRDILEYDPYGVPTFFDENLVEASRSALKDVNTTLLTDISTNDWVDPSSLSQQQQVVVSDDFW